MILIGIVVLLAGIGGCRSCSNAKEASDQKAATNAPTVIVVTNTVFVPTPLVTYATTPATLTVGYEFNVESDGHPIKVTYANGVSFVYKLDGKYPTPPVGPKTFTDPNGGNVSFRIYRVR